MTNLCSYKKYAFRRIKIHNFGEGSHEQYFFMARTKCNLQSISPTSTTSTPPTLQQPTRTRSTTRPTPPGRPWRTTTRAGRSRHSGPVYRCRHKVPLRQERHARTSNFLSSSTEGRGKKRKWLSGAEHKIQEDKSKNNYIKRHRMSNIRSIQHCTTTSVYDRTATAAGSRDRSMAVSS